MKKSSSISAKKCLFATHLTEAGNLVSYSAGEAISVASTLIASGQMPAKESYEAMTSKGP